MLSKPLFRLVIFVAAGLALAACGAGPTQTWPGLAADDQHVYVVQGQQVYALDPDTRNIIWAFPETRSNETGVFVADPGLGDGLIVVSSEGPANSYSGVVYGLDPATGQQRWCLALDRDASERQGCPLAGGQREGGLLGLGNNVDNRVIGGITIAEGRAFFGLANGTVYAVDAATGRDEWFFRAGRDVWAAPLLAGDVVVVGSLDHHLYGLDASSGEPVWDIDMDAAIAGTPTLIDGTVYVGTFADRLVAIDAASGRETWSFATESWVWGGPALHGDTLYFADVSGTVYAVPVGGQAELWRVKPGGQMRSRPAVTDDAVYIGDRLGNLFALRLADGSIAWSQKLKGQLLVPPVVANDKVVVTPYTGDNVAAAYGPEGGFVWAFAPGN